MSIKENVRSSMVAALKAGDKSAKQIYANILDTIQKAEKRELKELNDAEVTAVLQKYLKQCQETLQFAVQAGNTAIINSTKQEIDLLNTFLPEMMSEADIKMFIDELKGTIEPTKNNKGQYMKACSQLRGKADMKLVASIVDSILA